MAVKKVKLKKDVSKLKIIRRQYPRGKCELDLNVEYERWKRLYVPTRNLYFVSSNGRFATLNRDGYFKAIKVFEHATHKTISVTLAHTDDNGNQKNKIHAAANLILNSFVGGGYKGRNVVFKNGNKKDLRLKNLCWKNGFQDKHIIERTLRYDNKNLTKDGIRIKNYILNGDIHELYKMLKEWRVYCLKCFTEHASKTFFGDFWGELPLIVARAIDMGRLKPEHKYADKTVTEVIKPFLTYIAKGKAIEYAKKSAKELSDSKAQVKFDDPEYYIKFSSEKAQSVSSGEIYTDHENIEDEINELFDSLQR